MMIPQRSSTPAFNSFLCYLSVSGPQHNKTVVCYISTWAVYRPGRGSFNIDNFDPNLCTIAIYAFAGLDPVNDAIKSLGKLPLNIILIRFRSFSFTIDDCQRYESSPGQRVGGS